ncbi:hypothetical protein FHS51_001533 [Sphingobium wenxiniae]|nr:hypothetical protein [Sphingobium wenxiniae]
MSDEMSNVINLRQARKTKARGEKERLAQANRAKFGRSKAERLEAEAQEARRVRALDGARRDKDMPDTP